MVGVNGKQHYAQTRLSCTHISTYPTLQRQQHTHLHGADASKLNWMDMAAAAPSPGSGTSFSVCFFRLTWFLMVEVWWYSCVATGRWP